MDDPEYNVWATMEPPLSDIFQQMIVLQYLSAEDFVRLSGVSRRYRDLFRLSPTAAASLATILKRDATHKHGVVRDQLPTFGGLLPDQALYADPWFVARLATPALKRRRLVLLSNETNRAEMTSIVASFRSIQKRDIFYRTLPHQQQHSEARVRHNHNLDGKTQFTCVNLSGVDVYFHWIDYQGTMLIREGDRIPPVSSTAQPPGFLPSHVCQHSSCIYHSFALCFEQGGPSFAIYQQRRCWNYVRFNGQEIRFSGHAIGVLPAGAIVELHNNHFLRRVRSEQFQNIVQWQSSNSFYSLATGEVLPIPQDASSLNHGVEGGESEPPNDGSMAATNPSTTARELAEVFYGVFIPPVDDPCWQEQWEHLVRRIGNVESTEQDILPGSFDCRGPLCYPAVIGEAVWVHNTNYDHPFA